MAGKEDGTGVLQILKGWTWIFGLWSLKKRESNFNDEDRKGTKTKSQRPKTKSKRISDLRSQDFRNAARNNLTFLSEVLRG